MRRLVVCYVLPSHSHTIDVVVHQCRHTIRSGVYRREDVQRGIICRAPQYQFLTPVAEDVGLQVRCRFGTITTARRIIVVWILVLDVKTRSTVAVPLVNLRTVKQFILHVAIPIDTEIQGCTLRRGNISRGRTTLLTIVGGTEIETIFAGLQLCGDTTTVVITALGSPDNLSRCGIMHIPSVRTFLVNLEHFQSRTTGNQVRQVNGVSMSQTSSVKKRTIVVDGCRTVENLVATVSIYVSHGNIMITIAIHRTTTT